MPTGLYARESDVPVAKSKAQIEAESDRYGATGFGYGKDVEAGMAMISFRLENSDYRIYVPLPDPNGDEVRLTQAGQRRNAAAQRAYYGKLERQRWRGIYLYIKGLFEAAAIGVTTVERAFLEHRVIPGTNQTVGQWIAPQMRQLAQRHTPPPLLPGIEVGPWPALPEGEE